MPDNATKINHQPELYPLISIIIPTYNTEKYLARCVNSLLTQTYPNIELILVDDGSTDNSPAICDDFARKDSRVKVIHQSNKGTGAARNTGIDSARGELIGFADSDDFASPEMYAKLYALMLKEHADVSVCEFTFVDAQGNEVPDNSNKMKGGVMTSTQALEYAILPIKGWSWHSVLPWNKLYKAKIFSHTRFSEMRKKSGGEDTAIIHRVFGESDITAITEERLYFYVKPESGKYKFEVSLFRLSKFIVEDRFKYLTEKSMPYLAEMTLVNAYGLLVNSMREVNYLQYREEFSGLMRDTMKKLILSGKIGFELRALKLLFVWLRSLFRPFVNP